MSYQKWEEKRKYKRYSSELAVRFVDIGVEPPDTREGAVMNVSRGGVFIATAKPSVPGTDVRMFIKLVTPFGEEQEFTAEAKVMWVNTNPAEPGMGMSFTKVDRHTQYALLAATYRGEG